MLDGRDDYFDFTESQDFDISTIGRGNIIKFDGYMKVPEEFDKTQIIEKFKPMLIDSFANDSMDVSKKMVFETFVETTDTKIPVLIDIDGALMCSKLISNNMIIDYEELEEYEDLEITIVARVTSIKLVDMKKSFYDPLKDFMKLNRAIRRNIEERADGINEIYADKDYRTIEILAIYQ